MAFLFQDQNQGIRNDAPRGMRLSRPFSFIRTLTVGFGITPNLLTLFPAKKTWRKKALAGLGYVTLTAGGDFHPALRTSAARIGRPGTNYDHWPGRQQAPCLTGLRMSPCRKSETAGSGLAETTHQNERLRRLGLGMRESDSGLFSTLTIVSEISCG